MTSPADFEMEIDRLIEEAEHERRSESARGELVMHHIEELQRDFDRVAEVVHAGIIQPRFDALAARFAHTTVEHFATPHGLHSHCSFRHTSQFPATATVLISVMLDVDTHGAALVWRADIVPTFVDLDNQDRFDVTLSTVPWREIVAWTERRLTQFLSTYLTVQRDARYQQDNLYTDPVCGMTVTGGGAIESATFAGSTYFFCAPTCRERFETNPRLFIQGLIALPRSHSGKTTNPSGHPQ